MSVCAFDVRQTPRYLGNSTTPRTTPRARRPGHPHATSPGAAFRTVILVQAPTYTRPSGGISFF